MLVCCALDRIWSSTQRLEDSDWFRPKVPYVQYGGWCSCSVALESGCSKFRGELTNNIGTVEHLGVQPLPTWGAFSFIVQGRAPIYIYLVLCLCTIGVSFVLISRRGPLGQSGVGWLDPGWFSWATGCPCAVPSRISRGGLITRMVVRGSPPVLSAWAYVPYLQGYLMSPLRSTCQQDDTPGEGCITEVRPGASGHARWRNGVVRRGNHHYGAGGDVR